MSTVIPKQKVSDLPPTTLRLPAELRDQLAREAMINRRSISKEAEIRLQESFSAIVKQARNSIAHGNSPITPEARQAIGEKWASYTSGPELSETQRLLLSLFAELSPEKQLALLTVLKR